jgi:hypothetical protein
MVKTGKLQQKEAPMLKTNHTNFKYRLKKLPTKLIG